MTTATITSKGQLTLPKRVRAALGLETGDQVMIVVEDGAAVLYPVRQRGVLSVRGIASGYAPYPGRDAERVAAEEQAAADALRVDGA